MSAAKLICRLSWVAPLLLTGCLGSPPPSDKPAGGAAQGAAASTGGPVKLEFWHTRRGQMQKVLDGICADYERQNPSVDLIPTYQGSYDDLNKKLRASILSKSAPALTVAYENQVSEYAANDAVRSLDELVKDAEIGLTAEELADIPKPFLEANRYRQHGDQMLSFPFTKSSLVMYCNRTLLKQSGFDQPPITWPEFERQCAAISRASGKPAWSFGVSASTVDGIVYSYGGEILSRDGDKTLFDSDAGIKTFELFGRMGRAKTVAAVGGDESGLMFTSGAAAFVLDTSAGRYDAERQIGKKFEWDIVPIPHAEGAEPVTVLYGPNVCIFKSTPEREREAWKFIKYFISPEVTARWARETGYLPVRKSAVELPEMKRFYEENPRAWQVYQIVPSARPEPAPLGWQEVRRQIEDTVRAVIGGGTSPRDAAVKLKAKADQVLAGSR